MERWQHQVTFRDQLLPDGSVQRTYDDGRVEWRRRLPNGRVEWHQGGVRGVDQPLGPGIVKRTFQSGRVIFGREQGYGRTAWSDGTLTYNRTEFGGRMGSILAGLGAGVLLGSIMAPPDTLSAEEEQALLLAQEEEQRRAAEQSQRSDSGDSGGGGDAWTDDADDPVESEDFQTDFGGESGFG